MKRWVRASKPKDSKSAESLKRTIDSIPNIDNRPLPADAVISWLDRLVEVSKDEDDTSDN